MLKLFHSLDLKLKSCLIALFGSAFLAFGLYHVHSFSGVTEGGVLGMTLLLDHWFHISPSVSGFIMNLACYAMGWKLLGRQFIAYSILSSASFSLSYRMVYSILTVLLSGQIIGFVQTVGTHPVENMKT